MTTADHPTPAQMRLLKELDDLHLAPEDVTRDLHAFVAAVQHLRAEPQFQVKVVEGLHRQVEPMILDVEARPSSDPSALNTLAITFWESARSLGAAMTAAPISVSPQMARSLQAAENIWRSIDQEFGLLTSLEVAERVGSRKPNRSIASTLRKEGKIVGILRGNSFRFPGFQFDEAAAAVMPAMAKLIVLSRQHDRTDEDLVFWLTSASSFFHEQDRPVDHLHEEERVLAAARDQFEGTW